MTKDITNKIQFKIMFNSIVKFLAGILVLVLGILLVVKQSVTLGILNFILKSLLVVVGVVNLINWFVKTPRILSKSILPILTIAVGIMLFFCKRLPLYLIIIFFSIYLFIAACVEFVNTFLILKNRSGEFLFSLIPGIFYFVFALISIKTLPSNKTVFTVIGVYFMLLGTTYILDFVYSIVPKRIKYNIKRRIRIRLPSFMEMFIPRSVLADLNRFLQKEGNDIEDRIDLVAQKEDAKCDLEIFFHVAAKGFNSIGHCDIYFDGEVIAYGNYDEKSQNKLGMGPGVLIISNKKEYIPFCIKFNKTTIFSYGLKLSEIQKEKVRNRIKEVKSILYPWSPPYAQEHNGDKTADIGDYKDFASGLYKNTDSKFYKFKESKFKTYFVLTTNCVAFADSIVCQAGTDILGFSGIISTGTFYDYLRSEYLRKDSIVIKKDVYKEIKDKI